MPHSPWLLAAPRADRHHARGVMATCSPVSFIEPMRRAGGVLLWAAFREPGRILVEGERPTRLRCPGSLGWICNAASR